MTPAGWQYYQELRGQVHPSETIAINQAPAIASISAPLLFAVESPARNTGG